MCAFTKCCCCLDLRTGAIIIAILELVIGIPCFVIAIWMSIKIIPALNSESWNNDEEQQQFVSYTIAFTALNYLKSMMALITGLCLLFGSIFYNKVATLTYLVLRMIWIVVAGMEVILGIVGASLIGTFLPAFYHLPHPSIGHITGHIVYQCILLPIICMTVYIFVTMVLQTYFWICVLSLYNRSSERREIVSHS